VVENTRKH